MSCDADQVHPTDSEWQKRRSRCNDSKEIYRGGTKPITGTKAEKQPVKMAYMDN